MSNFEQHHYSTPRTSKHFFLSKTKTNIRKFCPTVIGKYYWNDLPFLFLHYQLKSSSKKQFLSIILFKIDFLACCCCAFWVCTCVCVVHVIYMCSVTVTFLFCRLLSHRRKLLCSPSEWVSVTWNPSPKKTLLISIWYSPMLETSPETKVFFIEFYRNVA